MHHEFQIEFLVLLAVSVVAVALFRRLNMTPILAYLLVGISVGPHGFGWVQEDQNTRFLAEFGVVFLLFTLGLEFSLPRLIAMRRDVVGLGGAQVVLSMAVAGLIAWGLGMTPEAAFAIGGVLALSSTAIVIKQLAEQLEVNSRHGRSAVGVLLFQDLAVIPLLIIIPTLSGSGDNSVALELGWALAKGAAVTLAMLAAGHWLLRPLFHEIARARSSELFTLTVLMVALLSAWATYEAGLSMALGAFLAGIMLSETEFRHQIETDIRPFRDVLLGLFFITIGMLLDVGNLPSILHWVLLTSLGILLFKTLVIFTIGRLSGMPDGVALRTGLVLAQGGEFGFALIALALDGNLLDAASSQVVLASVIFSMILTPFVIRYNGQIAKKVFAGSYNVERDERQRTIHEQSEELREHVILCGFGRVGQNIAAFAEEEGVPYLALELDPTILRKARQAGALVYYGDSTHREILNAAGINHARALLITHHDIQAAIRTVETARSLNSEIPILVRTKTDKYMEELLEAGATEVVPDAFEASLMLASHLLTRLDVSLARILHKVQDIRTDNYLQLRHFFHGDTPDQHEAPREGIARLSTFTLPPEAHAVGKRLGEIHLEQFGVSLNAVRRSGIKTSRPLPGLELRAGDVLVIYGTPEQFEQAENFLLKG